MRCEREMSGSHREKCCGVSVGIGRSGASRAVWKKLLYFSGCLSTSFELISTSLIVGDVFGVAMLRWVIGLLVF